MSSNDIVLRVENLSKCFEIYEKPIHRLMQTLCAGKKQYYKEFWALRDINFEMLRGECVGIIGRNGAGKSTLLQIITGTLAQTTGTVLTKGRIAALLELGSGFNPEFTGRENVYLNGTILGLTERDIDERLDDILAFADIGDFIDQPVKNYSSGMMARITFAVNAHIDADILIVDETLSVGDIFFQQKCALHLKKLMDCGTTLLFVSHSTAAVRELCSKALYLDSGKIVTFTDSASAIALYLKEVSRPLYEKNMDSTETNEEKQNSIIESSPISSGEQECDVSFDVDAKFHPSTFFESRNIGLRYGTKRAIICGIEVLNGEELPQESFLTGEIILFRMHVQTYAFIQSCCFNIKILTTNGIAVVHFSSFERGMDIDLKSNQNVIVDFRLKNRFGGGRSFIVHGGLTSIPTKIIGEHEVLDCIESCNIFSSINRKEYPIWDIVDLPSDITIHSTVTKK